MGQYVSAYLTYGVPLPEHLTARELEDALKARRHREVSYLMAGTYDRHKPYLVTACFSGEPGFFERVEGIQSDGEERAWDLALTKTLEANGWPERKPSWMLIASVS